MSGTSLDGVDAALIETDGHDFVRPLGFVFVAYEAELRETLRTCFGKRGYDADVRAAESAMTQVHVEAVKSLLALRPPHPAPLPNGEREDARSASGEGVINIIGFHGQTITHDPANKFTFQIGDAAMLTQETNIDVVHDFRSADVAAGGQGAPLLPLYHRARVKAEKISEPVAILNIGGVANVTYVYGDDILAFDTGPGNALIDDAVKILTGGNYDTDGTLAASGTADEKILNEGLAHPFFNQKPPKSLDRNEFKVPPHPNPTPNGGREEVQRTSGGGANTITTLSMFTVQSITKSLDWMPEKPMHWIVCGGGRKNKFIMDQLQKTLGVSVKTADDFGWNGDAIEAEGFGYLAVRSLLKEPISLPTTTGAPRPMTGGILTKAPLP